MSYRVFIVHGWDGYPEEGWFPWLKDELSNWPDNIVKILKMPHSERPTIEDWVEALARSVGEVNGQTYFAGHSIGCQTILRYLASQSNVAGGAVFVAGWFTLSCNTLQDKESRRIAAPWLNLSTIDFNNVRRVLPRSKIFFSTDDALVPRDENQRLFIDRVGSKVEVLLGKGHFSESDGVMDLPEVELSILEMMNILEVRDFTE